MRPLIAVSTRLVPRETQQVARADALVCSRRYLDAVRRAGGQEAALLEVPISDDEADDIVRRFDGLVLIGGADVDPARYGAEAHTDTYGVQADVDAFDIALARAAVRNGTPTLAICRGVQVLNVALGGTLIQHLPDIEGRHEHRNGVMHEVDLKPGTLVADAMGTTRPMCSSFHHQAIDRLAPGLVETGWADDGTIEAVEVDGGHGWLIGIQWHPEDTAADDERQQALFDELVRQAEKDRVMITPRTERPDMSDYGVPSDLADALPWSWAEERLLRNKNYWVITASAKGRPHAMPVWGVWMPETSTFAFSCSPNARKARNIRANPQVAFAIDDTVECVSVEGLAHELAADSQRAVAESYAAKYEPDPVKQAEMVTFVTSHSMWEVVPQRAFAIIEREDEFAQRATRWVWSGVKD